MVQLSGGLLKELDWLTGEVLADWQLIGDGLTDRRWTGRCGNRLSGGVPMATHDVGLKVMAS